MLFKDLETPLDEEWNSVMLQRARNIALLYELLRGNNVITDCGYKLKKL